MATKQQKKEYNKYVSEITPVNSVVKDMINAFWTGGLVCVIGQLLMNWLISAGVEKEEAGTWMLIILVGAAIVLTMFHIFGKLTKYAGAGLLVPITGFANSVAAPAAEYAPEGEVFGKGVQIFSIAGPVILYGVLSSWILGLIYWIVQLFIR